MHRSDKLYIIKNTIYWHIGLIGKLISRDSTMEYRKDIVKMAIISDLEKLDELIYLIRNKLSIKKRCKVVSLYDSTDSVFRDTKRD